MGLYCNNYKFKLRNEKHENDHYESEMNISLISTLTHKSTRNRNYKPQHSLPIKVLTISSE